MDSVYASAYSETNQRFCAYAHYCGMTPTALLADGFKPWAFMEFIRRELRAYCDSIKRTEARLVSKEDHEAFTKFLLDRHPEPTNPETR